MDSYVAEWDVRLTEEEIMWLRDGTHPLAVRPKRIVRYYICRDGFFRNSSREDDTQVVYVAPVAVNKEKTER